MKDRGGLECIRERERERETETETETETERHRETVGKRILRIW